MNDDEIKKYLVDFISEDMTVKYFGGFVSMKKQEKDNKTRILNNI